MKTIINKLSDAELLKLVEEIKQPIIPENSLTRKLIIEHFGEIGILGLQITQMLWPLLEEVTERFKHYSPYIV